MGIFTRFRDIVSANINSMLDKAEDPEKMIKLMIREMEDTLVEMKAACAGVMAQGKKLQRDLEEIRSRETYWEERAALAVTKGRDDLAREALLEKRRFSQRADQLDTEHLENNSLVAQYQDDIRQLEDKLRSAREKQRLLVQRHLRAQKSKKAREDMRRWENSDAIVKFEELENRIERMEAEADLVNLGRKPDLDEAFDKLMVDDEIEKELQAIKKRTENKGDSSDND